MVYARLMDTIERHTLVEIQAALIARAMGSEQDVPSVEERQQDFRERLVADVATVDPDVMDLRIALGLEGQ